MNTPSTNNTAALMPFAFGDQLIRTFTEGEVSWFVIADVCQALEIANPRDAAKRLDPDDVGNTDVIDRMGRPQVMNTCNESGLYQLIFQSRKAAARVFTRWVTKEVLPTLRKTGTYTTRPEPPTDYLTLLNAQLESGVDPTVAARIASRIHLAHAAGVQRSSRTYAAGSQGSGRPHENPLDLILPHLQPGQLYTIPQLLSFLPETHHLRRQRPAAQNSALGRHIRSAPTLLRDWSIPRTAHYHLRPA